MPMVNEHICKHGGGNHRFPCQSYKHHYVFVCPAGCGFHMPFDPFSFPDGVVFAPLYEPIDQEISYPGVEGNRNFIRTSFVKR